MSQQMRFANLGGFPALFIIITFNLVLVMLGTVKIGRLQDSKAKPIPNLE